MTTSNSQLGREGTTELVRLISNIVSNPDNLETTDKTLVGAINEVKDTLDASPLLTATRLYSNTTGYNAYQNHAISLLNSSGTEVTTTTLQTAIEPVSIWITGDDVVNEDGSITRSKTGEVNRNYATIVGASNYKSHGGANITISMEPSQTMADEFGMDINRVYRFTCYSYPNIAGSNDVSASSVLNNGPYRLSCLDAEAMAIYYAEVYPRANRAIFIKKPLVEIHEGTTDPTSSTGKDGDLYIKVTSES